MTSSFAQARQIQNRQLLEALDTMRAEYSNLDLKIGRVDAKQDSHNRNVHIWKTFLKLGTTEILGGENGSKLVVNCGHRYGLIGPNGSGKTTLLRAMASGKMLGWPRHLSCVLVEQESALGAGEGVGAGDRGWKVVRIVGTCRGD